MRKLFWTALLLLSLLGPSLSAAEIAVTEHYFNDAIVAFYLSDFDLENPQNNQLIFEYRIGEKGSTRCVFPESVTVSMEFTLKARIFSLGWSNYRDIATVTMSPFDLYGPMHISNQLLGSNVDETMVRYECPDAGPYVDLNGGRVDINSENLAAISNVIFATNKLPAGQYSFNFTVYNESEGGSASINREINISSPTSLQLLGPGSNSESSADFEQIFTKYPVFQWESENCSSCSYRIRICAYDRSMHSSPLSALQDESALPFPDDGGYFDLGANINTFSYDPSYAGLELEFGRSYVWQIVKEFGTTSGSAEVKSEIYAFTVTDPSGGNIGTGIPSDPVSNSLKSLIGESRFLQLFSSGGDLNGFMSNGRVTLNGNTISVGELEMIRSAIGNGSYTIQNISVE